MKHFVVFLCCFTFAIESTPSIFYIEGNTGSGKTTIARALAKKNPSFVMLEEPVQQVQSTNGINALQMMYDNQERWGLTVNLLYYAFHIKNLKKAIADFPDSIIVSDRSLFSGHAFCYADEKSGLLHPLEGILYRELSGAISPALPKPSGIIYIRTDPEISFARICTRSRKEEAGIDATYWHTLHEGHEQMLIHNRPEGIADVPVLVLECNEDMRQNASFISNTIRAIEEFIRKAQ